MGGGQSSYEVSPSKQKGMDENKNAEDPPLGIESGTIRSSCITASSSNDATPAHLARLNSSTCWCAGSPAGCFLEVDLLTLYNVTAVATQGNPAGNKDYVMKYKIQYSADGQMWNYYMEDYKEVIEGNTDNCTAAKHFLTTAITCRYVRIWPTAWFQWPCLRLELYGKLAPKDVLKQVEPSKGRELEAKPIDDLHPQETEIILHPNQQQNSEAEQNDDKTVRVTVEVEEKNTNIESTGPEQDDLSKGRHLALDQTLDAEKIALLDNTLESPMSDVEPPQPVQYDENFSLESSLQRPREPIAVSDDFKRLLEVKKKLEFEAELRTLKEQQKVELRRKKKRVRIGNETPEMFSVPRRVYAEMWGDSPSDSIERDLDKSATDDRPMIERANVGAPLAKLDDDSIDASSPVSPTTRTVITIRTVRTRPSQSDDSEVHTTSVEEDSVVKQTTSSTTQSAPDDVFMLLNGFPNEPQPFASRASCEHLHPADPATQDAMESSFHERLDSIDLEGGSPFDNKRFSGLDLLQTPYDAVSSDDVERLLAWEDETLPGWTRVKRTRDYVMWKGQAVDGGPPIIKTTIKLKDISYDEARELITNLDVRKEWDKTFEDYVILERTYNFNVIHCSIRKQGLTLAVLEDIDPDEPYHACVWSIADYPDNPSKMLRYETMIAGLVIRPIDDGTHCSKVALLCQLKGSVAQPLRNTFLTGNPDKWIEMLKKYVTRPQKPKVSPEKTPKPVKTPKPKVIKL